jgi:hypothetical protein
VVYTVIIAGYLSTSYSFKQVDVLVGTPLISNSSLSSNETNIVNVPVTFDEVRTIFGIFHIIGFLWFNTLIQSISMTTISGAVCNYYFTRDKDLLPSNVVLNSFGRTLRYNIGSVAFGSFFIAITQFFRVLLHFLVHQNDKNKPSSPTTSNSVFVCFFKMIDCILSCIERCLKFISKYAFVIVSLKGTNFCSSAATAISLIYHNMCQVGTLNAMVDFIIFLGKWLVSLTCCTALLVYIHLDAYDELSSVLAPSISCFIISFFISSVFFHVYEMIIDTILLCYCYDQGKT